MAVLECTQSFGNFEPGDTVLVPDGAVFDTGHFALLPDEVEQEEVKTTYLLHEEQDDKEEAE